MVFLIKTHTNNEHDDQGNQTALDHLLNAMLPNGNANGNQCRKEEQ
jgi:hypothetical protein